MSPTTLNLVAAGVFLTTLMILGGPALNLSPLVPSALTVAILALATGDRFLWDGQGGTLLVDWFANRSAAHRERVLHHEAGHFLVAELLGVPVTAYSLCAWEAFQQGQTARGGVQFDETQVQAQLSQGQLSVQLFSHYSTIWMAGIAAETLCFGRADGGGDDRQLLLNAVAQLRRANPQGVPPFAVQQNIALQRARTLLEQQAPAYRALVEAMRAGQSPDQCRAAIAQATAAVEPEPLQR
ncbi:MAG: hypothetical protein Fur0042_00480 [Cyanophyceae cyanobacterium]